MKTELPTPQDADRIRRQALAYFNNMTPREDCEKVKHSMRVVTNDSAWTDAFEGLKEANR